MNLREHQLYEHIVFIYGKEKAASIFGRIQKKLARFRADHPTLASAHPTHRVSERDVILITYGDMVRAEGQQPIQSLVGFLQEYITDVISTVHILPFFPFSSDDGFSVIDYQEVNPEWGDWRDIARMKADFRLMFDAVINHISAQSDWYQGYLQGKPAYQDYFFEVPPDFDTSQVFRPRALPLLTTAQTTAGEKKVWTTFSEDQIDLNYGSPDLLLNVLDVLLTYVANGAEFIRLDAIAFIWKESGTSCVHLPQTHRLIQLMRTVLDLTAPRVSIITETNVPHRENISYFGDGSNEAQMVYNFSLPPLALHAFHTGNAETLTLWAHTLAQPSDQVTFFNFLASHDGIGLMPARGYLSEAAIEAMAKRVTSLGGHVSYKNNPDGTQTAYELNINFFDALGDPENSNEPVERSTQRFLASQAIMLALRGVPGIYFHSLFGSRNWAEGVEQTGRSRTINRQKLQQKTLIEELGDSTNLRHKVFYGYRRLLQARTSEPAFHPNSDQHVLSLHPALFALLRSSPTIESNVLCLHNVHAQIVELEFDLNATVGRAVHTLIDLLDGQIYLNTESTFSIILKPCQVHWLKLVS